MQPLSPGRRMHLQAAFFDFRPAAWAVMVLRNVTPGSLPAVASATWGHCPGNATLWWLS